MLKNFQLEEVSLFEENQTKDEKLEEMKRRIVSYV